MKKSRIVLIIIAVVSSVFTIIQSIPYIAMAVLLARSDVKIPVNNASAIGVIGSADGPTSIFVAKNTALSDKLVLMLSAITAVVSIVLLIADKKNLFKKV